MKRRNLIHSLLISTVLFYSCSKEEDNPEQFTSFEGVVLDQDTDEPYNSGYIEIIGSELGDYGVYRETFPIDSDGRFNIEVTTTKIHNFQINVESNTADFVNQACLGESITIYCTLMKPDFDYKNIKVYAITYDE
jgi:hypothetical protein